MPTFYPSLSIGALAVALTLAAPAAAQIPGGLAAKNETVMLTLHADGAQVYDCKADAAGHLTWQFREPIATLMQDGKTVGRHFAGPSWERDDGSRLRAKPIAQEPGATAKDIPWLKLEVTENSGAGAFAGITAIQRINTSGGQFAGGCEKAGATHAAPYSADYVFLKKSN